MAPLYIGTQAYNVYLGSVQQKVYQGANLIVAGLQAGSLVIEDSTLDVAGGGTVNLRVKLGARPGSDVVVAASESIDGVSISPASRTFTSANWDTYQSFAVTADSGRLLIADSFGADELYEIDPDGSDSQGTRLRALPSGVETLSMTVF